VLTFFCSGSLQVSARLVSALRICAAAMLVEVFSKACIIIIISAKSRYWPGSIHHAQPWSHSGSVRGMGWMLCSAVGEGTMIVYLTLTERAVGCDARTLASQRQRLNWARSSFKLEGNP
jgi:hypothetical protein